MTQLERPDELVSVPRWVLGELIPMAVGCMHMLREMRKAGVSAALDITEVDMEKGDEAVVVAYETLHPED